MKHALAGLTMAALAASPVLAQERPIFAPTRDVTIDYAIDGKTAAPGQPRSMQMSVSAGGTRMRIEAAGAPGYMIMDRTGGRTVMVMDKQHAYVELPSNPAVANMFTYTEKVGFTRQGTDTVAGQPCTVWTLKREDGAGVACITAEGLLLRGDSDTGNGPMHIIATKVSFATLPDSVFQTPAGYKKMDIGAKPGVMQP